MTQSKTVLAIDHGQKRIGLAISDREAKMALPVDVIDATHPDALDAIVALAIEKEAVELVVGLPLQLDGSEGPAAASARSLAAELASRVPLKITLLDERMTTASADKRLAEAGMDSRKRRAVVDSVAAVVLLQTYLDSR